MTTLLDTPRDLWGDIRADLLSSPDLERAAVGFAGLRSNGGCRNLLLRDWMPVPPDEYLVQLGYHLEVSPAFWARAAKRARQNGEAVVLLHSHPTASGIPRFSPSDDAGERALIPKIQARASVSVGAVVVSPDGERARVSHPGCQSEEMRLSVVGQRNRAHTLGNVNQRFDRQVRALTRDGQASLQALRVGVVGAGGLGIHVIQQLIHLGIGKIVVIDPDHVDRSNLSRLVGATRFDAWLRRPKTAVAARMARLIGGPTRIVQIKESVVDAPIAKRLLDCDVVVGCTDNHWSRAVLNSIAFQYYVPVLDLGVELQQSGAMGGRIAWLAPGSPCLWCMNILDAERVRIEQLPPNLREAEAARGYISGVDEPAPAVVSINGAVASLAVTELLARFTGFAGDAARANLLAYRLSDGSVRRISPAHPGGCPTCSQAGQMGAGDLVSAPWRERVPS